MQVSCTFRNAVVWVVVLLMAGTAVATGATPDEAGQARVSPVIGPEFRVSDAGTVRHEQDPVAVWSDTSRRYLIVWDAPAGIMVRRMTADAALLTRSRRVSSRVAVKPACPAVAWNASNNEFLVVWRDDRNAAGRGTDVYGHRLSATGARLGGDIRISGIGAVADEGCPDVAWNDASKEYLVIWPDNRHRAARGTQVWGRRLNADGAFDGRDFRISRRAADGLWNPVRLAANDTSDEWLVTWAMMDGTGLLHLRARRVGIGGAPIGGDFVAVRVSEFAELGLEFDLAWDGKKNRYLVAWASSVLFGQILAADGSRFSTRFRIGPFTANIAENPLVAWNRSSGRYLVAWDDDRNAATRGSDCWGRLVAADGTRPGRAFRLSGPGGLEYEEGGGIAANSRNGEFVVIWEDGRSSPPALLYGRRTGS